MKKNKQKTSSPKSLPKNTPPLPRDQNNSKKSTDDQCISNALCICSKCHKLCLITPDFWAPPAAGSPKKTSSSNYLTDYQISLNQNVKYEFENHCSVFQQNSQTNKNFLFPYCPSCISVLTNQIRQNNDFYAAQQEFLNSPEVNSTTVKDTYLNKVESEITLLKRQTESMKEINNDTKRNLKKTHRSQTQKEIQPTPLDFRKSTLTPKDKNSIAPCILNVAKFTESDTTSHTDSDSDSDSDTDTNTTSQSSKKSDRPNSDSISNPPQLTLKDEYVQSQNALTFSFRPLGFCGVSLCLSFHITARAHYGCINGMRIGTMTPCKVPTREFDAGLFFLAHLVKCIAQLAKVDVPNLVVGAGGVFVYEEIKRGEAAGAKAKAATTDKIDDAQIGKGKLKRGFFDKPKSQTLVSPPAAAAAAAGRDKGKTKGRDVITSPTASISRKSTATAAEMASVTSSKAHKSTIGASNLGNAYMSLMPGLGTSKLIASNNDSDGDDSGGGGGDLISLSTMTKYDKRLLSGSADSLKPRFYASEALQLSASDLKTSRGVQSFRRAMAALMAVVARVLGSSTIASQFNFAYAIEDGGARIHGVSVEYDRQNPGQFTHAMKLLLFNLKSIQMKALEDDVNRINDEI